MLRGPERIAARNLSAATSSALDSLSRPSHGCGRSLGKLPAGGDLLGFLPEIAADLPDRTTHLKAAISSTLIASLELARDAQVDLEQYETFWPGSQIQRSVRRGAIDGQATVSSRTALSTATAPIVCRLCRNHHQPILGSCVFWVRNTNSRLITWPGGRDMGQRLVPGVEVEHGGRRWRVHRPLGPDAVLSTDAGEIMSATPARIGFPADEGVRCPAIRVLDERGFGGQHWAGGRIAGVISWRRWPASLPGPERRCGRRRARTPGIKRPACVDVASARAAAGALRIAAFLPS